MPLPDWITRWLSAADRRRHRQRQAVRQSLKQDRDIQLEVLRLEERRVLNADFSLVDGQLGLTGLSNESGQQESSTQNGESTCVVSKSIEKEHVTYVGTEDNDHFLLRQVTIDEQDFIQLLCNDGTTDPVDQLLTSSVESITIEGLAGDDTLTIDYGSGGFFATPITFNGGTQSEASDTAGDTLIILGGTFTTATYNFAEAPDSDGFSGNIQLATESSGTATITYTGLEPITNDGTAADVIFNLPNTANTDVVLENGLAGQMSLIGSTFENVTFAIPSNSLTINGGILADTITVASVDEAFRASLIINGGDGSDQINLDAELTLGSITSTANLDLTAETIQQSAGLTVTGTTSLSAGTGTITFTHEDNDFQGDVTVVSAGTASLRDINAIQFTGVSVTTLNVIAGGAITNAGGTTLDIGGNASVEGFSISLANHADDALTVGDNAAFTATGTGTAGTISIGSAGTVNFGTLTFNSTGAVEIHEDSATILTGASTAGSLVLTSTGSITNEDEATLTVTNNARFSGTSITLGDQDDDLLHFGTLTFNSAGDVEIHEDSATEIVSANIAAGLILTSAGNIGVNGTVDITGNVDIESEGTIHVNAKITADGTVTLQATRDINVYAEIDSTSVELVANRDVIINANVSATVGDIRLVSGGDVLINANVTTGGGTVLDGDGRIEVYAANTILLDAGIVVATGVGQMTGVVGTDELGEAVRTPPVVEVVLVPVDQGGSNVDSLGVGFIDVTVLDAGVLNYQIEVDWGDRTVLTYRPEESFSGGNEFASGTTYRLRYQYQPDNPPDPLNPANPIPVTVTIRYDGREEVDPAGGFVRGIVFREGGVELSTTVATELTVPGTGLFGFIIVTKSEIVPVELRQPPAVVPALVEPPVPVRQDEMYDMQPAALEQVSVMVTRLFFRRVDVTGREGPDMELPADAFERGLDHLFRRFPNGHYRVYLQEAGLQRIRLIREIHVYQGRIVPADFREDVMERQPGSESGSSQGALPEPPPAELPGDSGTLPAVDPSTEDMDDQPDEDQTGAAAGSAAALAAWHARRRIDNVDRALQQAGRIGGRSGRWRKWINGRP